MVGGKNSTEGENGIRFLKEKISERIQQRTLFYSEERDTMKILIIHSSDIHFRETYNSIWKKKDKFVNAFQNLCLEGDYLFWIITGDVAYSGKAEEYLQAIDFIDKVKQVIETYTKMTLNIIIIPGNHDCNHNIERRAIRETLIDSILSKEGATLENTIIAQCCEGQEEWREFQRVFMDSSPVLYSDLLLSTYEYKVGDYNIVFIAYNSSWISKKDETPGSIFFPIELYSKERFQFKADLIVSLLHHPYSWQVHARQRGVKEHIEKTSDIVLTGHEHIATKSRVDDFEKNYTEYIEGGILQNPDKPEQSEFNIITIDLKEKVHKINYFAWNKDMYSCQRSSDEWIPFDRLKGLGNQMFTINKGFLSFLNDAGATFTHPYKSQLTLDDIFVFPNLIDLKLESTKNENPFDRTLSANILKTISLVGRKVLLLGDENAGKTTLCKSLFKHYYHTGLVPILIKGEDIKSADIHDFQKIMLKDFMEQYSKDEAEVFKQLDNGKKVVMIDDFDECRLSPKYRIELLAGLCKLFRNVILTGNELLQIGDLISREDGEGSRFVQFQQYRILEFGHLARSKLINCWHSVGNEQTINDKELIRKHDHSKQVIDTIIGRNLVPSYPIFLLTILQTIEAGTPHDLKESPYGHYYGYLIVKALGRLHKSHEELDAYYNYLTELAFHLFDTKQKELSLEGLRKFHETFCEEYRINTNDINKVTNMVPIC